MNEDKPATPGPGGQDSRQGRASDRAHDGTGCRRFWKRKAGVLGGWRSTVATGRACHAAGSGGYPMGRGVSLGEVTQDTW